MPTPYSPKRGPVGAPLMIIGDSPSRNDLKNGVCFSGTGAVFFVKLLEEAGYYFKDCFAMTALDFYPPRGDAMEVFHNKTQAKKDPSIHLVNGKYVKMPVLANAKRVWETIDKQKPKFILALGSFALWMLTGNSSISAYRGSMMEIERPWGKIRLLPTFHPSAVMRKKEWLRLLRRDLQRINIDSPGWSLEEQGYSFLTYPTAKEALNRLEGLLRLADASPEERLPVAVDIETRAGYATIIGVAWSAREALVIPLTSVKRANYFTAEEEFQIILRLRELLLHPAVHVIGQNYHYDEQYLMKLYAFPPHCSADTMHMAHVLWTKGLPLSLDVLSSMFCEWYCYWKEDGKGFHKSIKREEDEAIYMRYNGFDCCYTWEIHDALKGICESADFAAPYAFQVSMHKPLSVTVNRGTRFDSRLQARMRSEMQLNLNRYRKWFESLPIQQWFAGASGVPWYNSADKLKRLFYEILKMEVIRDKKTKRPTASIHALETIAKREPVLKILCKRLIEYSKMNQFNDLYLAAKPSPEDGRMRCSYGLAGTDTFRLNSRGDAFGFGMNLQNISKG